MSCDVAIVIVTYNSAHVVEALLDSIPAALGDAQADVIVVDNGSTDGTATVLAARNDCRIILSENKGYAAGINRGVAASPHAPSLVILNPDVILAPHSIALMLEELRDSRVGIVAPLVREPDGSLCLSMRREPTLARSLGLGRTGHRWFAEYVVEESAYDREQDVDWALGAALAVSRECHDTLGGWDESYFLYSEETDFCLRARDVGFLTRFQPRAEVIHVGGGSGRSGTTHAMQATNRVRLYRRRHGWPASFLYLVLTAASELAWHMRGNKHSRAALGALLVPSRRPGELRASRHLVPR